MRNIMNKQLVEKDLGKHNNATTGFKALAKKTNAKIAGAQLAKMRDKGQVEEDFNGEYDDEAGMAKGSLHTLKRAVDGLMDTIDDRDNLPEWCQEKISLAEDYLVTVWDYIQSEKEQGNDPQISEHKKGVKAMKYTKKAKPGNPVAKHAMATLGGGAAGAHKDKKKAETVPRKSKHKKAATLSENWYDLRLQTLLNANIRATKK